MNMLPRKSSALRRVKVSNKRIRYEIKPGIFEEKRGIAALLFKNSGFYFISKAQ